MCSRPREKKTLQNRGAQEAEIPVSTLGLGVLKPLKHFLLYFRVGLFEDRWLTGPQLSCDILIWP